MQQRSPIGLVRAHTGLHRNPCGPRAKSRRSGLRRRMANRMRDVEPLRTDEAGTAVAPSQDARAAIDQFLVGILQSACEVIGADRAFLILIRDSRSVEVAAAWRILPGEIIHAALGRSAGLLARCFDSHQPCFADGHGRPLQAPTTRRTSEPALVALPLNAALRQTGILCIERRKAQRAVSDLDTEILQALAEQAGTALAAVRTHDALSRLNDILSPAPDTEPR